MLDRRGPVPKAFFLAVAVAAAALEAWLIRGALRDGRDQERAPQAMRARTPDEKWEPNREVGR